MAAVGRCSPRASRAATRRCRGEGRRLRGTEKGSFPPGQPEPQRWSRVGARRGTSVSDAGGARGAATAGARRRGPGRPHVRAAAAARAARGGVWGKPPPAAGTAEVRGRSPESGGEVGGGRGRARERPAWTSVLVNKAWRALGGRVWRGWVTGCDGLLRARPRRRGGRKLESPGAWAGRREKSEKTGLGRRPVENLANLSAAAPVALQTSTRKQPGQGISKLRGESGRRLVGNGAYPTCPDVLSFAYTKRLILKISLNPL